MRELVFPFSSTARTYGYVIWAKEHDAAVRKLLGDSPTVELVLPGDVQKRKNVDWKHRRISVGYSVTRALPESIGQVRLRAEDGGRISVAFE